MKSETESVHEAILKAAIITTGCLSYGISVSQENAKRQHSFPSSCAVLVKCIRFAYQKCSFSPLNGKTVENGNTINIPAFFFNILRRHAVRSFRLHTDTSISHTALPPVGRNWCHRGHPQYQRLLWDIRTVCKLTNNLSSDET